VSYKPTYKELERKIMQLERDAQKQKIRQGVLKKSNELIQKTFLSQLDAIFILDAQFPPTIVDCNPAAERVFGYTRQEMLGRTTEFLHISEAGLRDFQKQLNPAITKQGFFHLSDFMMNRKDDKPFHSEHTVVPLKNEEGERIGWVSVVRDTTEQKKMEEALKESENKYRALFESMAQGVFYQQADGKLTDVNPAALEIFGLTYDQFIRRTSLDPEWKVIHEDNSELPGEEHPSMVALRTGKAVRNAVAGVYNPQKNDFVWININAIPEFKPGEDKPHRVFVTIHDITAVKQTERALLQERDKAHDYLDLAGVIFISLNTEGNVTLVNRKACEILGYEEAEILGKNWIENFLPERWREEVRALEREVLAGEIEKREYFENPVSTRLGEERIIAWHNRILKDDNGNIIGNLCSGRDITELNRTVEALQQKEKALEIQTRHLEEVNTALRILLDHREAEKQEMRQEMLNNLKNMVLPYIEKMGKSVLDPTSKTYLDIIKSNLEELISPLLRISQSRDSTLTPTELKIADFIRHGKTSKEISEFLGVSINAISVHRYNIRRRLGILNKKVNLRSYLQNPSQ
jgi:PAS domain S-box-containing protein